MRKLSLILLLAALLLCFAGSAQAYVGPGAGFAFITSFFFLIATFFIALFSLMIWPIRFVFIWVRRRHALRNAKVKRMVVLGLDGMDPILPRSGWTKGICPTLKPWPTRAVFTG